jgi:phosphoglycerol geranylgeranyltransferase
MSIDWAGVTHVTKVDPAESLPRDLSVLGHTDLVLVGGSDGVTEANTLDAIERIRDAHPDLPVCQEPYSGSHVSADTVQAADRLAIPAVYNGDSANFVDKHVDFFTEAAQKPEAVTGTSIPVVGSLIESKARAAINDLSEKIMAEGYVVQNLDSKAAAESGVDTLYTPEQVAGAALATESFYDFPVFYVEYSGTYGGPEDVEAAAQYLDDTTLLYGGGIQRAAQTREILDAGADAVVVGDIFHEDPERFLDTIPE